MLATILALAAVAAAQQRPAGPPAPAAPAQWQSFKPASELFTVQFPGQPLHTTQTADYGTYKVTSHRYRLANAGGGAYYEASHAQMPETDGNIPATVMLDAIIDSMISRPGGKETKREAVSLNGCTGKEYAAIIGGELFLQGSVFLAGDQGIVAVYMAPTALANHKQSARRFLDSLTISKPCVATAAAPASTPAPKKTGTVAGTPDAATGWRLIASPESGFSALMPGPAEFEEELAQQKPFPLTNRSYVSDEGTTVYVVVECGDFPAETTRLENYDEIKMSLVFRGMEAEAKSLGAQITLTGSTPFAGFPARQYRLTSEGSDGRALVVSTPRKVFTFLAFSTGPARQAGIERFFSSIKLGR